MRVVDQPGIFGQQRDILHTRSSNNQLVGGIAMKGLW
jgi:hypothetical protein